MDSLSPYLQAVQGIPGTVPGQKFKELNLIAQRIIDSSKTHGYACKCVGDGPVSECNDPLVDCDIVATHVEDVAEPLQPLVKLEIANILQQYEGVLEAFKSEDSVVVNRAMTMSWFFRTTPRNIMCSDYFEKNVVPYISLDTRVKLIKRLAMNLRISGDSTTAESFYRYFAEWYGSTQAEPLLVACSDASIRHSTMIYDLTLSMRIVRILFVTKPQAVINYLNSFPPASEKPSGVWLNQKIGEYTDFLPRLIKKHTGEFIKLLEKHNHHMGIKLSTRSAEKLLKDNEAKEALLNNPKLYTQIMPLKVIAAKLTKSQYASIFPKLLPEDIKSFAYYNIKDFLEYYPEQERIQLVMDAYKEVYHANFLDNTTAIDENFLLMLPREERQRQARIKLATKFDPRDDKYNVRMAWRCYLPVEETIPLIMTEISKSSKSEDRVILIKQMFYTCKVNEDDQALLEALRYFTTRHKNETIDCINDVVRDLADRIDLFALSKYHWEVLNDFIQFLRVKGQTKNIDGLLIAGVHYELIHDLPINDKIEMILEDNMQQWRPRWSILEKYPEYDRRCIDAFMTMIPEKYPRDNKIWKGDRKLSIVEHIVEAIYEFNTRNTKANCKIEKLSIKNYPWLLEAVKEVVQATNGETWKRENIISLLKTHEKDLHREWIPIKVEVVASISSGEALQRLNKDPKNILDNWEKYLEAAIDESWRASAHRFIRESRWHQEIPIKFTEKCLQDYQKGIGHSRALELLGILMQGDEYARIIEPLLPKDSKIDSAADEAKTSWDLLTSVPKGMNMTNPPVPLRLILQLCQGDYLCLGLSSLTNACRRTSLDKIEPFVKALVDRRVSVKKHGIRLYWLVASIPQLRSFLAEVWKTEKHRSIRAVIFEKVYNLFLKEANTLTWMLVSDCFADFTVDDNDNFSKLTDIRAIPRDYVGLWVEQVWKTLEKLRDTGLDETTAQDLFCTILSNLSGDLSRCLDEKFCQGLMLKHFCNPNISPKLCKAGQRFVLDGYLAHAGTSFEERLKVLCQQFEYVVVEHWDHPHPEASTFFPVNYYAHEFMTCLMYLKGSDDDDRHVRTKTMESVLQSFLKVLKPGAAFYCYVMLTYGIALQKAVTSEQIVDAICRVTPELMHTLPVPALATFVADASKNWVERILFDISEYERLEEVLYDLMDRLCILATEPAAMIATKILYLCENTPQFADRRLKIIRLLSTSPYPMVTALIYHYTNTRTYPEPVEKPGRSGYRCRR